MSKPTVSKYGNCCALFWSDLTLLKNEKLTFKKDTGYIYCLLPINIAI